MSREPSREKSGNEMGMYDALAKRLNEDTAAEKVRAGAAASTSQSLASSPANTVLQPQSSSTSQQAFFGGSHNASPARARTSSIFPFN